MQRNNLFSRMIVIFAAVVLFTTCLSSLNANAATPEAPQILTQSQEKLTTSQSQDKSIKSQTNGILEKEFTLKEISGSDGFILTGANANRVLYLPVPPEWIIENITLQMSLYSSSLFGVPSTFTVLINGSPINSARLDGHFNINSKWHVTIPGSMISGNIISLTLNNLVDDFGTSCYNLTNPKFWLYVNGSSLLTYHYRLKDYHPDLTKFPYPFINNPGIEKDRIIVIFPDHPTLNDYTAAFYLSNALINRSSWRGVDLIATTVSQITDEQKKLNHLIYIGTPDQLQLSNLPIKWPLIVNHQISDSQHHAIDKNTGIIMLNQSPWNPNKAILVITGNHEKALIKAADMLRRPDFSTMILFNQYVLIPTENKKMNYHPNWTDTTLSDLNYPNQYIYGSGQNSVTYTINLPLDKKIKGLDISLDYSSSPFLSRSEKSFLTVRVNDIPIDGITIKPGSSKIQNWEFYIDGNSLQNGENKISFVFNLYNQNQRCRPEDSSLIWGTIYGSSKLKLDLEKDNAFLNFKIFKASPYDLIMSVPSHSPYFSSLAFSQQVLNLSKTMPLIANVRFIDNNQFNINLTNQNNVIFISDLTSYANTKSFIDMLPFRLTDKNLIIQPVLKPYVAVSHEIPISINEIIRSNVNPNHMILYIHARDAEGFENSIDLYTDQKKSGLIDGNTVLLYKNGMFTSLNADKISTMQEKKKNFNMYITYAIVGMMALGLIIFIIRMIYRRVKQYTTPREDQ